MTNFEINTILDETEFRRISYFDGQDDLDYNDVDVCTINLLKNVPVRVDDVQQGVCLLIERGSHYIATIFAAWRAGFYVVPLNTSWPEEKNNEIINRINPIAVISDDCNIDLVGYSYKSINVRELFDRSCNLEHNEKLISVLRPEDIAYIIFTSGSTGDPKGVVISAASFRSYIDWTRRYFADYSKSKRLLLTSELTFDITMGDIAFALAFGTSIGVAQHNTNIPNVLAMIMEFEIDVLYSVPTTHLALTAFAKRKRGADLSSLNLILSGGDRFPWQLVTDYKNLTNGAHFYNVYGPTEVTINCFSVRLDDKSDLAEMNKAVPIGNCFDSLDYVLLDDFGKPAKQGELCIAGPQIMMGYYCDEKLSEQALIVDPRLIFVKRYLYRTGDLAHEEDGLVYLKGRIDGLVKVRGYRIHPDEVSKVLDTCQGVAASATIAYGSQSEAALAVFIKLQKNISLEESDICNYLSNKIPSYMIPNKVFFVDEFPLNQSGKIDKKSLGKSLL